MTDPTCPRCGRPIHDMAYVCDPCSRHVAEDLTGLQQVIGEEEATIAKLDAIISTGGEQQALDPWSTADSALYPTPLPVNLAAAERWHAAVNALTTTARAIEDERGVAMFATAPCTHATCRSIRARNAVGPHCPDGHPLRDVVAYLSVQVNWLRYRQDGDKTLGELQQAARDMVAVVDRPADKWYAGNCDCGEPLWPQAGVSTIRCQHCGAEHDADDRRAAMLVRLEEVWLEPTQCAHALGMLGLSVKADTVRKWGSPQEGRALLAPHPDSRPGRPRYRVGSVRALVEQLHAEQRERAIAAAVRSAETAARRARHLVDS